MLLQTFGEKFMSTAPFEIFLLRKTLKCPIFILPAVYIYLYIYIFLSAMLTMYVRSHQS